MSESISEIQLELRRRMGNPRSPAYSTQEVFERDDGHLRRLLISKPGTLPSSGDLYEYVQDVLHTKVDTDFFRFVLPFCMDAWRQDLTGQQYGHGGMVEYLYLLLAKEEVFNIYLLPKQADAVSQFMRTAILDEIERQSGLSYRSSKARPYRWIRALTSYGVLRPDIHILWNNWWKLESIGCSVAYLQYISCLMYEENENPVFAPWTSNEGGGPPVLSEFEGHLHEHCWHPENVEFLQLRLDASIVQKNLSKAALVLKNEPEYPVAFGMESDFQLCVDNFKKRVERILVELRTRN